MSPEEAYEILQHAEADEPVFVNHDMGEVISWIVRNQQGETWLSIAEGLNLHHTTIYKRYRLKVDDFLGSGFKEYGKLLELYDTQYVVREKQTPVGYDNDTLGTSVLSTATGGTQGESTRPGETVGGSSPPLLTTASPGENPSNFEELNEEEISELGFSHISPGAEAETFPTKLSAKATVKTPVKPITKPITKTIINSNPKKGKGNTMATKEEEIEELEEDIDDDVDDMFTEPTPLQKLNRILVKALPESKLKKGREFIVMSCKNNPGYLNNTASLLHLLREFKIPHERATLIASMFFPQQAEQQAYPGYMPPPPAPNPNPNGQTVPWPNQAPQPQPTFQYPYPQPMPQYNPYGYMQLQQQQVIILSGVVQKTIDKMDQKPDEKVYLLMKEFQEANSKSAVAREKEISAFKGELANQRIADAEKETARVKEDYERAEQTKGMLGEMYGKMEDLVKENEQSRFALELKLKDKDIQMAKNSTDLEIEKLKAGKDSGGGWEKFASDLLIGEGGLAKSITGIGEDAAESYLSNKKDGATREIASTDTQPRRRQQQAPQKKLPEVFDVPCANCQNIFQVPSTATEGTCPKCKSPMRIMTQEQADREAEKADREQAELNKPKGGKPADLQQPAEESEVIDLSKMKAPTFRSFGEPGGEGDEEEEVVEDGAIPEGDEPMHGNLDEEE